MKLLPLHDEYCEACGMFMFVCEDPTCSGLSECSDCQAGDDDGDDGYWPGRPIDD